MILIIDYGMGNIHSVQRQLNRLKVDSMISSDPTDLAKADKLILPGVGHFGKAMENLQNGGWLTPLNKAALDDKKPVLGICLGMQLMTKSSTEGNAGGLGWFDAEVTHMEPNDNLRYKIPHTGWNTIEYEREDPILQNVPSGSEVYFVHGFGVLSAPDAQILSRTTYETPFVSSLRKDNLVGMQFHPEKSHEAGLTLLKNFVFLNERMQK